MDKPIQNLNRFLEESGYQILTTITDDKISDKNTLNVYLSNKLSDTAEALGHEDPYETHHTQLQVAFNDTGKIKIFDEDLIAQDKDFFKRVSELANTSPEAILDTIRERAEWSFNNFIESDFGDKWKPMSDEDVFELWRLWEGRADGLEVSCEETGETYLKEIDDISNQFTITIKQDSDETTLIYNVAIKDENFQREAFLRQHGDTLQDRFNSEQVEYITNQVAGTIQDHLLYSQPQKMSFEEHEVATEFFGATDIEVNKVKTVKNDNDKHNCITTVDYQGDKYILNLEAEKQGDTYTVDMKSLENDSKDNIAFNKKLQGNTALPIIKDNFDYSDIENKVKENLEKEIITYKIEERIKKKTKGIDPDIDF